MIIWPLILLMIFSLTTSLPAAWGMEYLFSKGKEVYEANCTDCHRVSGKGLPGTFPAHDGNPFVVGPPEPVIATVLNGRKGNLGLMPTWKDKLDDTQIAAVVTYIRHAWSNKASAVSPAMVAEIRRKSKSK